MSRFLTECACAWTALALVGDPVTVDWLTHHHVRETKHVAALQVRAVAAAAAGLADAG